MIISKASLEGIQTNFKVIAMQSFENAPRQDLTGVVDDFPMTTGKLSLAWVAVLGKMREWLGDRQVRDIVAKNYDVTPRHFEHTIGVSRDDIEDDNLGQYAPQIRKISVGAVRFLDDMVGELFDANSACYDGQPLVDDSHPAFGPYAAFDNKAGTTGLTADATGYAAILAALNMMLTFKDAEGRSLGLSADTLVVPSSYQLIADTLVKSPFKIGTTSDYNALSGLKTVVLQASATHNWGVVDSKSLVAPLVRAIRKQPEFVAAENPTDTWVFKTNQFLYGVDARLETVPGFPQAIVAALVA